MKTQTSRLFALLALVAGLGVSTSARADFTFNGATSGVTDSGVAGVTLGLSGVTIANNTTTAGVAANATWTTGVALTSYGGAFGISTDTGSTPGHALDNYGNTEGVLLGFNSLVTLSNVGLSYTSNALCTSGGTYNQTTGACSAGSLIENGTTKVDVSLFRWTGTTAPAAAPALGGVSGGTMSGWELVGNYNMGTDTVSPTNAVNTGGKASSWWLISAYNTAFTGASDTASKTTVNQGDDYFKLFSVAGTKCTQGVNANGVCGGTNVGKLPEPATLALTGVALVGVAGLRRRKAQVAA